MSGNGEDKMNEGFTVGELELLETLDPRLEKLVLGELSEEEKAALDQLAGEDEALARALAAYAPLGEELEATITDSILDGIAGERAPAGPGLWEQVREWFSLKTPVLVPALALCSVLALWMPNEGGEAALPVYGVTVSSYEKQARGAGDPVAAVPGYSVNSRLVLVLRPATAVSGEILARVYLRAPDGVSRVEIAPRISEGGAIRVEGLVGEHFPAVAGEYELLVVVSRGDRWPSLRELKQTPAVREGDQWEVYRQRYVVRDRGDTNVP